MCKVQAKQNDDNNVGEDPVVFLFKHGMIGLPFNEKL